MKEIIKKISYLKGLCKGYGFDESTKEGVVFNGILDVLDELTDYLECPSDDEEEYSYAFICPNCGQELEIDEELLETEEELTCCLLYTSSFNYRYFKFGIFLEKSVGSHYSADSASDYSYVRFVPKIHIIPSDKYS